jgi:RNA polymerase sigma-70 factor (ECF subfamily)
VEETSALPVHGDHRSQGDESTLLQAARTDPNAFAQLYERYEPRIYRYLRARAGRDGDAEDLTQQVFVQALDALPRYQDRGLPLAAWLFRIARNVSTNALQRRRSALAWDLLPESLHPLTQHSPESQVLLREELEWLHVALAELDRDKRELMLMRFGANLSVAEIASVLGKSEASVYKQLSRVLRKLKERYDDEE